MSYNSNMLYAVQKRYAHRMLSISKLFSCYYQKKILQASYNSYKNKKKFREITKVYENWFTTHNINY